MSKTASHQGWAKIAWQHTGWTYCLKLVRKRPLHAHMHYAKLCNTASLQSTPRPVTVDAIDFRPMDYGEALCIKHPSRTGVIQRQFVQWKAIKLTDEYKSWVFISRLALEPWIQNGGCMSIDILRCVRIVLWAMCVSRAVWKWAEDYLKKSFYVASEVLHSWASVSVQITQRLELWLVRAQDVLNSKCHLKHIM